MKVEPLEPRTEDLIRKNKRGKYRLDDSEINQDLRDNNKNKNKVIRDGRHGVKTLPNSRSISSLI
jgi:hypothetical protein